MRSLCAVKQRHTVSSLILTPTQSRRNYCWKTYRKIINFAPSTRLQSHLNRYSTIQTISSSITTQTLVLFRVDSGYSRKGVRVKRRHNSRGHDSPLSKNQTWLSFLVSSVSITGVPGSLLGDVTTKFVPLSTILSNEVEIRNGRGHRRGWSYLNFSSSPGTSSTIQVLTILGSPTMRFTPSFRPPGNPMDSPTRSDWKVTPPNENSGSH